MTEAAFTRRPAGAALALAGSKGVSLCEALDRLLDTGVVAHGDVVISVADVDLVYLGLRLLLSSVETARRAGAAPAGLDSPAPPPEPIRDPEVPHRTAPVREPTVSLASALTAGSPTAPSPSGGLRPEVLAPEVTPPPLPHHVNVAPDDVKNGLAQLVMIVVKLLHELLERQALKRIGGDSLTDDQIERLGCTLMRQAEEIRRMQERLGLTDEEMNLDLGPLGRMF